MAETSPVRIGIVIPGDPQAPPEPSATRWARVFDELTVLGAQAEAVVYTDAVAETVSERLTQMNAVLVWINPLVDGRDRTVLDAVLREVASSGVFVSAHPDVILKMGTKDVLYSTRHLPWGVDTQLYETWDELAAQLPAALADGPRVLKRHRGNDGNGVWRVTQTGAWPSASEILVEVQHALRGAAVEELPLSEFLERCRPYFAAGGCMVDQPFQQRLGEGMIRCYLVHDKVVGFGHQIVTALLPPPAGQDRPPDPAPRRYYGPSQAEFQHLRTLLEGGWVARMQRALDIDRDSLPVIWDADFLLGPRNAAGEDTYVLCEINVSSVFPIPDEAFAPLAAAAVQRARTAHH